MLSSLKIYKIFNQIFGSLLRLLNGKDAVLATFSSTIFSYGIYMKLAVSLRTIKNEFLLDVGFNNFYPHILCFITFSNPSSTFPSLPHPDLIPPPLGTSSYYKTLWIHKSHNPFSHNFKSFSCFFFKAACQ